MMFNLSERLQKLDLKELSESLLGHEQKMTKGRRKFATSFWGGVG